MSGASSAKQEDVLGRPERVLAHVAPVGHEHVGGHHRPRSVSADEASVAGPGAERLAVLPRVHELVQRHEPHRPQRRRFLQAQLDCDARARRHEALARIRPARPGAAITNLVNRGMGLVCVLNTSWSRWPAIGARSFCPPGLCSSARAATSFCRIHALDWRWPLRSLEIWISR
jgi:hypothetical protein